MKRFTVSVLVLILLVFITACGDECENENPSVQLVNNGPAKADIQIKTSGGNTENLNNIPPGTKSERRTFAPGDIEFTIAIQGVNDPITYDLKVVFCTDYMVTIHPDTTVTGSATNRD